MPEVIESWAGWRENKLPEIEERAQELYQEVLLTLTPGVHYSTKRIYEGCFEKAEEEILREEA